MIYQSHGSISRTLAPTECVSSFVNERSLDIWANAVKSAFWTYFSAVNIVTDLAIIAVMVEAVRRIQTFRSRKLFVAGVFGSRIL